MIYLQLLPDEILDNIFIFINDSEKIFLNKCNYYKYHNLTTHKMNNKIFECYIRDIIRLDYSFVFDVILKEKLNFWLTYNKSIYYQKFVFANYFEYINYLINKYKAGKIKNLFISKVKKSTNVRSNKKIININNNMWLH